MSYQLMANNALAEGENLYKVTPKFHYFDEVLGLLHTLENPRFHAVWLEEDLAGQVARVAKRCHPRTVYLDTLLRWHFFFMDEVGLPMIE